MKILLSLIGFLIFTFLIPNIFGQEIINNTNNDGDDIFEQGETYGPLGVFDYSQFQDPDGSYIDADAMGERIITCAEMQQKNALSSDVSCAYWVLTEEGIKGIVGYELERIW